jgi:hypothetical protein
MRFPTRARTAARSWWPTLLALAVGASRLVTAQAPVARTKISTFLLMSLLGCGTTIEIELPDDVRFVHVVEPMPCGWAVPTSQFGIINGSTMHGGCPRCTVGTRQVE